MWNNFGDVLYVIGGFITVITLVAVGFVIFRGSYNKARIEQLNGHNNELRSRVEDLETAAERHAEKEKAWEEERRAMMSENQTLLLAATQRAEVDVLKTQLKNYHSETMKAWGRIESLLQVLVDERGA